MKKALLLTLAIALTSAIQAAVVDWKISLTGTYLSDYSNSSIYSYAITSTASTSIADVIASWSADNSYAPRGEGVWAAEDTFALEGTGSTTGSIAGMELAGGRNPEYVDYLVVVLQKDDGSYMWSAFDGVSDPDVYISTRGETEPMLTDNVVFNNNSTWTEVGGDAPGVPEPTALALLALGVAGVALRRRA